MTSSKSAKYFWSERLLLRFRYTCLTLAALFLLPVLLISYFVGDFKFMQIFGVIGFLFLLPLGFLRGSEFENEGSYVEIKKSNFHYFNPNNNLSIEFPISDINKFRKINLKLFGFEPIFTFLRITMKKNKYFSLYFYDVDEISNRLLP